MWFEFDNLIKSALIHSLIIWNNLFHSLSISFPFNFSFFLRKFNWLNQSACNEREREKKSKRWGLKCVIVIISIDSICYFFLRGIFYIELMLRVNHWNGIENQKKKILMKNEFMKILRKVFSSNNFINLESLNTHATILNFRDKISLFSPLINNLSLEKKRNVEYKSTRVWACLSKHFFFG